MSSLGLLKLWVKLLESKTEVHESLGLAFSPVKDPIIRLSSQSILGNLVGKFIALGLIRILICLT